MIEIPPWAALVCLAVGCLILAITFWPAKLRLRQPQKPTEKPAHEICYQNCHDPLCHRYGCPSDPNWKGDMR